MEEDRYFVGKVQYEKQRGGRFRPEWVAGFSRNQWQLSAGISGRFQPVYAVADLLISKGANVNAKDNNGETPLAYAVKHNSKGVAGLLISKGADVNAKDKYRITPISRVNKDTNPEMYELLVSHGAKIK